MKNHLNNHLRRMLICSLFTGAMLESYAQINLSVINNTCSNWTVTPDGDDALSPCAIASGTPTPIPSFSTTPVTNALPGHVYGATVCISGCTPPTSCYAIDDLSACAGFTGITPAVGLVQDCLGNWVNLSWTPATPTSDAVLTIWSTAAPQPFFTRTYGSPYIDYCEAGIQTSGGSPGTVTVGWNDHQLYFLSADKAGNTLPPGTGTTNGDYHLYTSYAPNAAKAIKVHDVVELDAASELVAITGEVWDDYPGYTGPGDHDAFVMVIDVYGNVQCVNTFNYLFGGAGGTNQHDVGYSITVSPTVNISTGYKDIFVTGYTEPIGIPNNRDLLAFKLTYSTPGSIPTLTLGWNRFYDINVWGPATARANSYAETGRDILYSTTTGNLFVSGDVVNNTSGAQMGLGVDINMASGAPVASGFCFAYSGTGSTFTGFKTAKDHPTNSTIYIAGTETNGTTGSYMKDFILLNLNTSSTILSSDLFDTNRSDDDLCNSLLLTQNGDQYMTGYSALGTGINMNLTFASTSSDYFYHGGIYDNKGVDLSEDLNQNFITIHGQRQLAALAGPPYQQYFELTDIYYSGLTGCDNNKDFYNHTSGTTSKTTVRFFSQTPGLIDDYCTTDYASESETQICSETCVAQGPPPETKDDELSMDANAIRCYPTVLGDDNTVQLRIPQSLSRNTAQIDVVDCMGRAIVAQQRVTAPGHISVILGSNLSSGMYFLTCRINNAVQTFKVIRQ